MSANPLELGGGVRRAAILMVLLGPETAGLLLRNLPRDQVRSIAAEVAQLDEIDPELAQAVLDQYFVDALRSSHPRGGNAVAQRLLQSAEIPEGLQREMLGIEEPEVNDEVLAPLLEAPAAALAATLAEEHPQTVALVLLNLNPAKAAAILGALPAERRTETLTRMTLLKQVPGEILGEVAASLQERLGDAEVGQDDADGLERTAEVLRSMLRSEVRSLLEEVEKEEPEKAQQLRTMVNTFDTLILADDRGIQELLRAVETKTLALALDGEEEALLDKFLNNLSERAAGMFREEMELLGTVRPDDRKTAQQTIMEQALQLEQDDKLTFTEPAEA